MVQGRFFGHVRVDHLFRCTCSFVLFVSVLSLVPCVVFLDCPYLNASSVFSNVHSMYLLSNDNLYGLLKGHKYVQLFLSRKAVHIRKFCMEGIENFYFPSKF